MYNDSVVEVVDHHILDPNGITPETNGQFMGASMAAHVGTTKTVRQARIVTPYSDMTGTPFALRPSVHIHRSGGTGPQGSLGLLPRVDLLLKFRSDSPILYGVKVQLIGDGQDARTRGFKLGMAGYYGEALERQHEERKLDPDYYDPPISRYDTKVFGRYREGALLLGYRVDSDRIFFQTTAFTHVRSNARITVDTVTENLIAETWVWVMTLGLRTHLPMLEGSFLHIEAGCDIAGVNGVWDDADVLAAIGVGYGW